MRPAFGFLLAFAALSVGSSVPAFAQDARTEVVRFAKGASSKSLSGTITGRESVRYRLDASAGQRMSVQLDSSNRFNFFNVSAAGSATALFVGSESGNSASVVLPSSGTYEIDVYLMRNAARRGETAKYQLTVAVEGK